MTRKDYAIVARAVFESALDPFSKEHVAKALANKFEAEYSNFKRDVFIKNCLDQ